MTPAVEQLEAVVRATGFAGRLRFTWFGRPSPALPPKITKSLSESAARDYMTYALQLHLYAHFYTPGGARPSETRLPPPPFRDSDFVAAVSAANGGSGQWQAGWEVVAAHGAHVEVWRDGLTLRAALDDCRTASDAKASVGQTVSLRWPKELPFVSPGFHMVLGDREPTAGEPIVRLYWHIGPRGAIDLVAELTRELNGAEIGFRMKVLDHPRRYERCDAAVVYLGRASIAAAADALRRARDRVADDLRPSTPALTKPLFPGIALAEDPSDGESFGMSRCSIVARALVNAGAERVDGVEERLRFVLDAIAAAALDPARPYLNPGSHDDYRGF
jgi:hypothetical protein